ncbi:MAG: Tn3 family transposase, partial [Streptosporangiaceae bacterium]
MKHWDDLLRLEASIHEGAVLPSLLLTKLQAFPRQNALARALQEHGGWSRPCSSSATSSARRCAD